MFAIVTTIACSVMTRPIAAILAFFLLRHSGSTHFDLWDSVFLALLVCPPLLFVLCAALVTWCYLVPPPVTAHHPVESSVLSCRPSTACLCPLRLRGGYYEYYPSEEEVSSSDSFHSGDFVNEGEADEVGDLATGLGGLGVQDDDHGNANAVQDEEDGADDEDEEHIFNDNEGDADDEGEESDDELAGGAPSYAPAIAASLAPAVGTSGSSLPAPSDVPAGGVGVSSPAAPSGAGAAPAGDELSALGDLLAASLVLPAAPIADEPAAPISAPLVEPVAPAPAVLEPAVLEPAAQGAPLPVGPVPPVEPAAPSPVVQAPLVEPAAPLPVAQAPLVEPAAPLPVFQAPPVEHVARFPDFQAPLVEPFAPFPVVPVLPVEPVARFPVVPVPPAEPVAPMDNGVIVGAAPDDAVIGAGVPEESSDDNEDEDWDPMDVDEEEDGRVHEDQEELWDPMDIQEDATMTLRRGGWRRQTAVLKHGRRRRLMALPLGVPAYRFAGPYTVPWYKGLSSGRDRRQNTKTGALVEYLRQQY